MSALFLGERAFYSFLLVFIFYWFLIFKKQNNVTLVSLLLNSALLLGESVLQFFIGFYFSTVTIFFFFCFYDSSWLYCSAKERARFQEAGRESGRALSVFSPLVLFDVFHPFICIAHARVLLPRRHISAIEMCRCLISLTKKKSASINISAIAPRCLFSLTQINMIFLYLSTSSGSLPPSHANSALVVECKGVRDRVFSHK